MNPKYEEVLKVIQKCMNACNACFDTCLKEKDVQMMAECIQLDQECVDVCAVAVQVITRNSPFTDQILELCATVCDVVRKSAISMRQTSAR